VTIQSQWSQALGLAINIFFAFDYFRMALVALAVVIVIAVGIGLWPHTRNVKHRLVFSPFSCH